MRSVARSSTFLQYMRIEFLANGLGDVVRVRKLCHDFRIVRICLQVSVERVYDSYAIRSHRRGGLFDDVDSRLRKWHLIRYLSIARHSPDDRWIEPSAGIHHLLSLR